MKHLSFGQHLVEKGVITPEQHETALQILNKSRLLGEIAIEMDYLSHDDIHQITDYMERHPAAPFGAAAVSLGLINANQLRYLLDIQTRRRVMIGDMLGDTLLEQKFVDEATLHMEAVSFHQKRRKLNNILIVEPSSTVTMSLERMIRKYGYNVYTAANSREAIALLNKHGADLIVTDCYLPGKDGYEFTREVKKMDAYRHVPIIMVTAADGLEETLKGLTSGASDYIVKLFDEAELIARAGAHLFSKRLFDEVAEERDKLEKVNDEKNNLLGMAAHDLRNPISSISGFAHLMLDESYTEKRREIAELIKKTSEEMLSLIDNLLDISAIESGNVTLALISNDLNQMIETRVKLLGMIATQKGITLDHKPSPIPPFVFDLGKIQQVVDNLISNAIKFTHPGGRVGVTTSAGNGFVRVEVTDNGVGIPEKEQKHLFSGQKKISVRPTGGERCTGYGLIIAAKIVKAHNGTIGVKSRPGAGSSFFFTLPLETAANMVG